MQLQWSKTVIVHGRAHGVPKPGMSIGELGANVTDNSIQRVGRSLQSSTSILENFDRVNNITPSSGRHTVRSSEADTLKQVHNKLIVYTW